MDMMTQNFMNRNKISHKSPLSGLLVAVLTMTGLTACGGGLSGDENETDPVVVDNPVAFIKRPLQFDENDPTLLAQTDIRNPAEFNPGAVLYLKNRATPSADVIDLTSHIFADPEFLNDEGELLYDVKDLDVSYDGRKLLFSMRAPEDEDLDEDEQPTWNIWEYDVDANQLRRIISNNAVAEEGEDIAPTYLPDGRILFSSTRQQDAKALLLDEGKPQYPAQTEGRNTDNFVLHVMNADGTDIRQLTFNQSHDLDPVVMSDGTIVFSRWDSANGTTNNGMNLYQINPDGTGLTYLYGRHSHAGGIQFAKPQQAENGNIVVQLRAFEASPTEWQPTEVDFRNYVELNVPLVGTDTQGHFPVVNGMEVNPDGLSLSGVYGVAFPLYDGSGRYLTSWSPCLLVPVDSPAGTAPLNCTQERIDSGDYEAAIPHFGLWIRDTNTDTQLPIEQESTGGVQYDEAVLMNSRSLPDSFIPAEIDTEAAILAEAQMGILHIRSVYDLGLGDVSPAALARIADPVQTPPAQRPARFVRIEKPVSIPSDEVLDFDNSAFGRAGNFMREILGYAPIEPDGSVKIAVPANMALAISVLNADGEAVFSRYARHANWLQVAPGETVECNGCHAPNTTPPALPVPHGRPDAEPASINAGAATTGVAYPNSEPALSPDMGDTMAETWSRVNGIRRLTPDIVYEDDWTDADITPKAASFTYAYADMETPVPITPSCELDWTAYCRITIHYPYHIHTLWSLDRRIFDVDGETLLADHTCTSCHAPETDDGEGNLVPSVPAGQLDLTDGPSDQEPDHLKSYRELLFGDNQQELNENGILVDRQVGTGQFVQEVDEDGNPVFDEDGNPVFVQEVDDEGEPLFDEDGNPVYVEILTTVPVEATSMNPGARNSGRFFNRFGTGGSHEGYLSPAELKLIREWLDIGAQYYNNPFDPGVPVN